MASLSQAFKKVYHSIAKKHFVSFLKMTLVKKCEEKEKLSQLKCNQRLFYVRHLT